MQPLHALVKNGRLTLDEPTDLPDGQVVALLPFEAVLSVVDELTETNVGGYAVVQAPRAWKPAPVVHARSLIDELRSM
jgi:hypothetical protein